MADPVTAAMVNSFLGAKIDTVDTVVDGISTLATTIDGKVDTVDTVVDTINTKVDNLDSDLVTAVSDLTATINAASIIPIGDKMRVAKVNMNTSGGGETTLLNVASGGGILHNITLRNVSTIARDVNNFKFTIDGAAERNYGSDLTVYLNSTGGTSGGDTTRTLLTPIPFDSSLIIKAADVGGGGGSAVTAILIYSVN